MRLISMSITDAATHLPPTPPAERLPDDPAVLKSMILELLATLHDKDRELEGVRHRLDLLLRRLYGPRGERFDPNQPLLFAELAEAPGQDTAPPPADAAEAQPKRKARPHGRRPMPKDLRHEARHHELPEAERVCPDCGQMRVDIGVDQSSQLDYQPASLFVVDHLVHKYLCRCCSKSRQPSQNQQTPSAPEQPQVLQPEPQSASSAQAEVAPQPTDSQQGQAAPAASPLQAAEVQQLSTQPGLRGIVVSAPKPEMPIAKGLPGPGLLAHLIVSKFADHLPLYRLERIYERQGLILPRSTTCDWLAACGQLVRPLYELMISVVLQSRVIHTDDTPVKMQEPSHVLSTARFWGYLGDGAHPYNVFDFTINRKRDGPQQFLAKFQGYLQADAFTGYDGLYLPNPRDGQAGIIEVACNAHARRKFYEARTSAAAGSHQALAYYRELYEIERRAHSLDFDDDQRRQLRQDLAVPILNQFRAWLDEQRVQVLPKSPMAEAIGYALNQWQALCRYTEAGFLNIDNNVAEREMKRIAIGRKNWLFVGSQQGGHTAAVLLSFTSTCQRLRIEPWAYLKDILTRLPNTATTQLDQLLPDRWEAARQAAAAAAAIAASPTANPPAGSPS
jgi:transposase